MLYWIMPIRVESQADLRRAQSAIPFCYLCGMPFAKGDVAARTTEHVFAKKLLAESTGGPDSWTVTLRVHKQCEESLKKRGDNDLAVLQTIHTRQYDKIPLSVRASARNLIMQAYKDGIPDSTPAVSAENAIRAFWQTVRGMHTVLYAEPLAAQSPRYIYPPCQSLSATSNKSIESQLSEQEWARDKILAAVSASILADSWDGVTAWHDELRYRCAWWRSADENKVESLCFWVLDTPPSLEWAMSVMGQPIPWCGAYKAVRPHLATMLQDESVEIVNAERERHRVSVTIANMLRRAGR